MNTPEKKEHHTIFCLLIISTLIFANCQPQPPAGEKLSIPDAYKQNERLGGGANVGSILYRWDNWDEEREKEELDLLKGIGLKGVRINTRPFLHASEEPPYTISQEFFDRLDWLVNEALERGFTVIIDEHQYWVMGRDPIGKKDIFLETWRQMAEHYKDYPDNVYFGVLNEPNNNLTPYLWNFILKDVYKVLRESNPARTLVIGPGDWNNIEGLEFLELPGEDRNIIVEIHYYSPHRFTHQGVDGRDTLITWGSPEERKAVENDFNIAAEWAKRYDRPLYLGEFGVSKKADQESAVQWLRFVREQMEKNNMSWAMWNMMGSNFGMYYEEKKEWIEPRKNAVLLLE